MSRRMGGGRENVVRPTGPFPWTIKCANDAHSHELDKLSAPRYEGAGKGGRRAKGESRQITRFALFALICSFSSTFA